MKALFHTVVARLHGFLRSRTLDSDFNQELEEHLAMSTADKIRHGMPPEEARREARVELGGLAQLREYLSEVAPDRFRTPMKVADIPRLFTPTTFCKLVVRAQKEAAAAA